MIRTWPLGNLCCRHLAAIFLTVLLTNCASRPRLDPVASGVAWDGRVGPLNKTAARAQRPHAAVAHEYANDDQELSRYTVYSNEWWEAKKAIDDKEIGRLGKITNICSGC